MSDVRICKHCDCAIPDGHLFCGRCGSEYSELKETTAQNTLFFSPIQAPGKTKLILISGEDFDGMTFYLNATEHTLGRGNCSIPFPEDLYLSDQHVNFFYRDNQIYMKDLDSQNGTFIRVHEPRLIKNQDVFLAGSCRFRLEYLAKYNQFPRRDGTMIFVSPPRQGSFRIVQIMEGGILGRVHSALNDEIVIGRDGADLTVSDDIHMSSKNTKIYRNQDGIFIEDINSKNGTYIEVKTERKLANNDYIFAGKKLLRVEINSN